jgi:3-dehydroshikimate dehydratase
MRRSIATVSMSGTLREKLEAIAAARFDAIEVFENDLIHFSGSPAELRTIAADLGLGIDLYQPFRDFEGVPDAMLARNLDRAERKFDVMEALGAPMILVCSSVSPAALPEPERAAAQLHALAERAMHRNILVGYEALAWGRHVRHYRDAWSIVQMADHPNLGLIIDSFHTLSLGDDPTGIASIPGDRIFCVQLADAPRLVMDVLKWSRSYRCFPGQGQFDLPGLLEQILIAGYTGPLSLEVFNDLFREAPNRRTALDAMQSLLFLEAETRKRLETGASAQRVATPAAAVLDRVELFDPPSPPQIEGFAFIEFAVDDASGGALAHVLETLGFQRAGFHRAKSAALYRHAEFHVVLKSEPTPAGTSSASDALPAMHGVGVLVDDPVRALNRAIALQCPRLDAGGGLYPARTAAIRAPDDTAIYFIAATTGTAGFFEREFVPADHTAGSADPGLMRADHIALALPVEQLQTWVLFCRAVLGMQPGDSLELSDPYGLVRSCGIATDNRKLRVVLNVSESRSTQTAHLIAMHGGASIHHVAFASDDLFATIEKLRAAGVQFVPISANYYDDLPTRFEMPDALVRRLQHHGVLYDRSAGGEYFHVYTEIFAQRFFFEIVQRVGRYDAFGALNAPARLASQAQRTPQPQP